jgi:ElaB/YqjD/DUF883 family membrane-anchored ribosome-binding protein
VTQPTGTTAAAPAAAARPAARTPEQIEAEIEATRTRLTDGLETLKQRVSPMSIAQSLADRAMRVVRREDGSLDPVKAGVAAGVVIVLGLYLVRRRRI